MKNKQPTILLVTHVIPYPPAAGNEIRILKLIKWLKRDGFRVVLILNMPALKPGTKEALEKIADNVHCLGEDIPGVKLPNGSSPKLFRKIIDRAISNPVIQSFMTITGGYKKRSDAVKRGLCPDELIHMTRYCCMKYEPVAVIAEYIFTSTCLDMVPNGILKLVDTHDIFSRRNPKETLYCSQEEERNFLLKSDVIMAIQPEEAKYFKESVPERKTITAGVDCEVVPMVDNSRVVPGRILLVGSDNMANLRGLKSFFSDSWPLIRGRNPGASLRIVGKVGAKFNYSDERVSVSGWVEDLMQEYEQACIVINPTTYGTGLKIKTLEALCRAKPLVATSNSIEGLSFKGSPPCVVSDNWEEFAERIIHLLGDGGERQRLQNMALSFARENFVPEKVYAELALVLDQAGGISK